MKSKTPTKNNQTETLYKAQERLQTVKWLEEEIKRLQTVEEGIREAIERTGSFTISIPKPSEKASKSRYQFDHSFSISGKSSHCEAFIKVLKTAAEAASAAMQKDLEREARAAKKALQIAAKEVITATKRAYEPKR